MSALKNDKKDNKPDYSLLPKIFLDQVAYVMMAGERKYGRFNYLKGHKLSQLTAAAVRHIKAIEDGEDVDNDTSSFIGTQCHHAGNAAACMLMLLHQLSVGTLVDDRFTQPVKKREAVPVSRRGSGGEEIISWEVPRDDTEG